MTSERFIPEHRRTQFKAKNTFKPDELRRRREEQQVEIRKQKREENLAKRRGISGRDGLTAPGASLGASIDSDDDGGTIESQVCTFCLSTRYKGFHLYAKILSLVSHCYMLYSLAQSCSIHFLVPLDGLLNASFIYPNTVQRCLKLIEILSSILNSPKWLKEYSRVK